MPPRRWTVPPAEGRGRDSSKGEGTKAEVDRVEGCRCSIRPRKVLTYIPIRCRCRTLTPIRCRTLYSIHHRTNPEGGIVIVGIVGIVIVGIVIVGIVIVIVIASNPHLFLLISLLPPATCPSSLCHSSVRSRSGDSLARRPSPWTPPSTMANPLTNPMRCTPSAWRP